MRCARCGPAPDGTGRRSTLLARPDSVAMWKPLEILLYDWWPVRRRVRTYENLAKMKVEVRYT